MIEGIIQKTFEKYDVMHEDIVWLLDRIEKELISEIKKELELEHIKSRDRYIQRNDVTPDSESWCSGDLHGILTAISRLIGDTK